MKPSALDEYLKDHKRHCALRTRFSDPVRVCSCGRDKAAEELEHLRTLIDLLQLQLAEAREDERDSQ